MNKKVLLIVLGISFTILLPTSIAVPSIQTQKSDFEHAIKPIISQDFVVDKIFAIGRITNLQIEEDSVSFNPINLWYFGIQYLDGETIWYVGHTKNLDNVFRFSQSEFKGILTQGFICGIIDLEQEVTPTITFSKTDMISTNTLTVISASPADVDWSDLELQVDGTAADHGMSGTVTAGDIIDITAIAGTGAYTITIRHIPTNTLIGSWDFE